jgi:hypothetical protein
VTLGRAAAGDVWFGFAAGGDLVVAVRAGPVLDGTVLGVTVLAGELDVAGGDEGV